ncbi:helix-turn-helix transcriptional regulator [Labrys sp. ZIDIC5]|uniref:helix-turn-helix transcriptional regulator n=1 Tax=Labrys sedimenti TaxID=3106036 RepID=UPI002ACACB68|nr:helix-turn-helix transcriptional regulator [Labrys sp. ZIDIC5]MDZ5452503.1 helix-turn-helix transcriptional regulator [Labrys sp. ZIDIC5]
MNIREQSAADSWHHATPDLVLLLGSPQFAPALDTALRQIAPFDLSCIFAYPLEDRPTLLHDGLNAVSSSQIMANYLAGTYLLDAVYTACMHATPAGLYRLHDLAPDAFFEGEYYNSPDVHPCISMESGSLAEEIVFLHPLRPDLYLAYSLLRQNGSPSFTAEEMADFTRAAPMVMALLGRQWQALAEGRESQVSPAPREHAIEQAFLSFAPTLLTPREQTIVSLVLRGHSSLSISSLLDIAEGTVKIHRKNIYAKLGISSQTELFNQFIRHLLAEK